MRNKVILIGGGLVLLIILWVGFKSLTKDTFKPKLDAIIQTNYQSVALAKAASDTLNNFNVQVAATNIAAVITSDDNYLATYYKNHYKKKLPAAPKNYTAPSSLTSAQPGSAYDGIYQSTAQGLLKANVAAIQQAENTTTDANLKAILDQMFSDQTTLLAQLGS